MQPSLADDFQRGDVGFPQLIGPRRLLLELIGRLFGHEDWVGDQSVGFQEPVNAGFGHEVALGIVERHGPFNGRSFWLFRRHLDNLLANGIGDTVPHPPRPRGSVFKARLRQG